MKTTPRWLGRTVGVMALCAAASCAGENESGTVTPGDTRGADTTKGWEVVVYDTTPTAPPDTSHTAPQDTTVTSPGDTTSRPDTDGGCDGFGCPCQSNGDCVDELCIEGIDGLICTQPCSASCPDGYDCVNTTAVGPDPISICLPRHTRLCRPCREHADCQNPTDPSPGFCVAADDPADGSFCGSSCANRACPSGYACESVDLAGGGSAQQCVPSEGAQCGCRPAWAGLGYVTDCAVTNGFGSCDGTRECGELGLTACSGPQPTAETCNGKDNDCDGITDNIAATPCQVQNLHGSCDGVTVCGELGPVCDGPEAVQETCNGENDDCDEEIDEESCDDSLHCTVDTCTVSLQCDHELTSGWCVIDGSCHADQAVNPQDPCEVCDADDSPSSWVQAGNTCVIAGKCYPHNGVSPHNSCLICDTTRSTTGWSQAINTCDIQGKCYAAGVAKPGEPCFVCSPSQNASGWTAASTSTPCNDGSPCSTDDHCNGLGQCTGDTSCDDDIVCTKNECTSRGCSNSAVAAGWCRIGGACYAAGTANPVNGCQRCNSGGTSWASQPSNVPCSDGDACTTGDHCSGTGSCVSGPGCSDGLTCTTDLCNPATGCSYPTAPLKCKINDECFSNNQTQSGNVCYKCDSRTPGSWSFNNGATCDDSNSCTLDDKCSSGTCTGPPKKDASEDNNTNTTASNQGSHRDDGDWPYRTLYSTLYPAGDIDWYRYDVSDHASGDIQARVRITSIPSNQNYELCIWLGCTKNDLKKLECPSGSSSTTGFTLSGIEYRGCCSNNAGSADENIGFARSDFNCKGIDDDYRAYIRVRNMTNNWGCTDMYKLELGDD